MNEAQDDVHGQRSPSATATHVGRRRRPCWTNTMVATIAPGPASSGRAERHEGDVDALGLGRARSALAGQQLQRDQQQEQPAGALQRRQA